MTGSYLIHSNPQKNNRFTQLEKLCQLSTFFRSAGQLSESGIYIPIKDEKLFVLFHRRLEFDDGGVYVEVLRYINV